jgi:beta-lactamase superfamily II metal-dependent hydrolase
MGRFIQYSTKESLYDGEFGGKSGWPAAGMGDVIVSDGGKIIAVDGGNRNDGEGFLRLLEECSGNEKPTVDYWIITHPHIDHYGALLTISQSKEFRERLSVGEIIWYFPPEFEDNSGKSNVFLVDDSRLQSISQVFGAKTRTPYRGEELLLDGIKTSFLYVPDDCSIFGSSGKNFNLCSLIFSISGKRGRVMVTGDAFPPSMQITALRYGKKLKSDALQMPHHALCDSFCREFYQYVSPSVVFMPISKAGYREMHGIYSET